MMYFIVRKAHQAIAHLFEGIATTLISGITLRIAMNIAIDLDNERALQATKVNNIRANRMLAPKTQPGQPPTPQFSPKLTFCNRLHTTKRPRMITCGFF